MTIRYVDLEAGNDVNDGLSFANRKKTITSASTGASAGDVVRVMGSLAPTSLGQNGTWISQKLQATVAIASSTNATPIVVTTSANHGYANGDTVYITGHTTNTNANGMWEIANKTDTTFELIGSTGNGVGGASGTVRLRNNSRVMLTSAVTQNIASWKNLGEGRVAWTQSANVTASLSTSAFKCADVSDSFVIAAGFTTGLAAYFATGLLDLSTKQQVSFWIKQTTGTVAIAGDVSLRLCSDTVGAVSVQTLAIPALGALNAWVPITINIGGALPAVVNSIALYVDTDRGAQTFLISNVVACKAATSLTSWIGKNAAGETWWPIQSINGTRVVIDQSPDAVPTSTFWRGYYGASETVTTWKREAIANAEPAAATSTVVDSVAASGSLGSLIAIEGGWDRTGMSTQTLETWIDGRNGKGSGLQLSSKSYITLNKFSPQRFYIGIELVGACVGCEFDDLTCNANVLYGLTLSTSSTDVLIGDMISCDGGNYGLSQTNNVRITLTSLLAHSHGVSPVIAGSGAHSGTFATITAGNNGTGSGVQTIPFGAYETIVANDNAGVGIYVPERVTISSATANRNSTHGMSLVGVDSKIRNLAAADNTTSGVFTSGHSDRNLVENYTSSGNGASITVSGSGANVIKGASIAEAAVANVTAAVHGSVLLHAYGDSANDHRGYYDGGRIDSEATVRHTASGISWKLSPSSVTRNAMRPLALPVGRFLVTADVETTITLWMRRTNTGLTARLLLRGGQVAGVTNDVSTDMTAAADTWEQVSITFTPTATEVVEVEAQCWGGTTYSLYVDDVAI